MYTTNPSFDIAIPSNPFLLHSFFSTISFFVIFIVCILFINPVICFISHHTSYCESTPWAVSKKMGHKEDKGKSMMHALYIL